MQNIIRIFSMIGVLALGWSVSTCRVEQPAAPFRSQTAAPPTSEQQGVSTPAPSASPEYFTQTDCPGLESALLQIVQAPDPVSLAHQLQLNMKADKLQVMLILAHDDTSFLQNFEAEVGTQLGEQIQAFAPIDRLCELARTDEVVAIRLPARIVTQ